MASAGMPGIGIRGVRERLRQLGGAVEINAHGTGTVVVARLPYTESSRRLRTKKFVLVANLRRDCGIYDLRFWHHDCLI